MKIFVLALVLPFASCAIPPGPWDTQTTEDDCPTLDPVECDPPHMWCGGGVDSKGCAMPDFCHWIDPYAHCSAYEFCPVMCPDDMMPCPGGESYNGCPMPDTCHLAPSSTDLCPVTCPVYCDWDTQLTCGGGLDSKGCAEPTWCMDKNPNCYWESCPVDCGSDEMSCPGGVGWDGCPLPDTCISLPSTDSTESPCYTSCPVNCGSDQLICGGGLDYNGCEMPSWCMDTDDTAICAKSCPTPCPQDSISCWEGKDYMGCDLPMSCHPNDRCVDVKVTTVSWGSENSWTLGDCSGSGFEDNQEYDSVCCLTGGEHTLTCSDTYGDGWHGGYIEIEGTRDRKSVV